MSLPTNRVSFLLPFRFSVSDPSSIMSFSIDICFTICSSSTCRCFYSSIKLRNSCSPRVLHLPYRSDFISISQSGLGVTDITLRSSVASVFSTIVNILYLSMNVRTTPLSTYIVIITRNALLPPLGHTYTCMQPQHPIMTNHMYHTPQITVHTILHCTTSSASQIAVSFIQSCHHTVDSNLLYIKAFPIGHFAQGHSVHYTTQDCMSDT